jgi:hypothetical protein
VTRCVDIASLMDEVTSAEKVLIEAMYQLSLQPGGEQMSLGIIAALPNKLSQRHHQLVNAVLAENVSGPSKPDSTSNRPSSFQAGQIENCGIEARDLLNQHRNHQRLRKALIENMILIFLARNTHILDGVVYANVTEEMKRLRLSDESNTLRGRLATLKKEGALEVPLKGEGPIEKSGHGFYKISAIGYEIANKALITYGLKIDLPPFVKSDSAAASPSPVHVVVSN